MQPGKIKCFAVVIVAALGLLLATVPIAGAQQAFQCTGTISDGSTIDRNLIVPANAFCTLTNVKVAGNVHVGTGATFSVSPATGQTVEIDGNIAADRCFIAFLQSSGGVVSIEGNVTLQGCTSVSHVAGVGYVGPKLTISGNFLCANNSTQCNATDGVVQGNLTVDDNSTSSPISVFGNQVSGNVDISGNTAVTLIVGGNTISGNLQCFDNSSVFPPDDDGSPNTVSGHKQRQCANF
jgi:hypothetical protein